MPASSDTWKAAAAPVLAALAALSVVLALTLSIGFLAPAPLWLMTGACAAALTAAWLCGDARQSGERIVVALLAVGVVASWAHDLLRLRGSMVSPERLGSFRPLLAVSGVALAAYAWRGAPRAVRAVRFLALVGAAIAAAGVVIHATPAPGIDVWTMQQQAGHAILEGRSPYALLYRNIYGPGTPFLDPSVLTRDGRWILAFPYMPLVAIIDAVGVLAGDVRWPLLAAVAASAFLVRALGRGSVLSELAAALLVVQPEAFMVAELAWTEPLVLATVLLTVLAVRRASGRRDPTALEAWGLPGLAAALALSTKQYVPLFLLPLLLVLPARARLRAAAVAIAGAAVIVLPFLLAGPADLYRGIVEFQLRQPFRTDALSWPAAVLALGGPRLPAWPAFLAAGIAVSVALVRPWNAARSLLAGAGAWLVFVLLSKQAFANYYWLAVGLLCAGVALLSADGRAATDP